MTALAQLWRHHRAALLVFAGAAAVTVFFALRFAVSGLYWADPAHRDRAPEGWMTPGYLARSWDIPREVLAEALGLERKPGAALSLARIARDRGQPLPEFLAEVEALLEHLGERP